MDAIVEAALKKWPNVPHCYGWLALDGRGDWYMRDDRVQKAGPFPRVKGSRIEHDKLREFIARNYAADEAGRWFFQNGPQRVYVELEAAPFVWRLDARGAQEAPALTSHNGLAAAYHEAIVDETGRLFVAADRGFGLVHTLDIELAADAIDAGHWRAEPAAFATLPARFGYRLSPSATSPR